jgi:hypothetical protein
MLHKKMMASRVAVKGLGTAVMALYQGMLAISAIQAVIATQTTTN